MSIRRLRRARLLKQTQIKFFLLLSFLSLSLLLGSIRFGSHVIYASDSTKTPGIDSFTPQIDSDKSENLLFKRYDNLAIETFSRPKYVTIKTKDTEVSFFTQAKTVREAIQEQGILFDTNDIAIPDLKSDILADLQITIVDVEKGVKEEVVELAYGSSCKIDDSLYVGKQRVLQQGIPGIQKKLYEIVSLDGETSEKTLLDSYVEKQPINEVVAKGTKFGGSATCMAWDNVIDSKTSDPTERYWLKSVMRCESHCNENSVSGTGAYKGMFQFSQSTFDGWGGKDIFNGEEQIELALKIYRLGYSSKWPACNRQAERNMPDMCTAE